MRWLSRGLMAGLVAAGLACGDDPVSPGTPSLRVVLDGTAGQVGAVVFRITGGAVDSVVPTQFYTASTIEGGGGRRVVVLGDRLDRPLARLYVPNVGTSYVLTVLQVADATTGQLLSPTRFTLRLER